MTYFTTDNTEGQYTTEQLAALNARVAELMTNFPDKPVYVEHCMIQAEYDLTKEWFA